MAIELLTLAEVAERYRVSRRTVKRWTQEGHLQAFRTPTGGIRFRADDVEALLTPEAS